MNDSPWFLGIDLGTGSCKSVVVDERATVLAFGVSEYSGLEAQDRWQEQDPRDLLRSAVASVRSALSQASLVPEECGGLSIGGALHSVLALDHHGAPLTGLITWADGRAVEQARVVRGLPISETLNSQTGCPVHGMYPLYKIMWLREERPEIFRRVWRYVSAKEYVWAHLTGEYMVDFSLAAGSGFLNAYSLRWNPLSLNLAGIREEQLSLLCAPVTIHNGLAPEMALQMGLTRSVPVVLGSSDAANSSIGAGAAAPWQATCMVGTSGAFRVVSPRPMLDGKSRTWCYAIDESNWLVGGAINNGGVALSWFRDLLNLTPSSHAKPDSLSFEDVLELASQSPAGAGGVICLPFFAGERSPHWNLNARAVFFGMTLGHNVNHLARALVEGIGFRFRSLDEVLGEIGVDVRQIVASGGFTKSGFWLQVMSDVLGRELVVPEWGETSALGAAFWALLATGRSGSLEEVVGLVRHGTSCLPDPVNVETYRRIYPLYSRLYRALGESFDEVAELQRGLRKEGGATLGRG